MFGLKIFDRVKTFRRVPPVLPRNFCHPAKGKIEERCTGKEGVSLISKSFFAKKLVHKGGRVPIFFGPKTPYLPHSLFG